LRWCFPIFNTKDPSGGCVFNISKETTKRELISIEGIDERTKRMSCLNLSGGFTNAVEIACAMWKLPDLDTMLDSFIKTQP